MFDLFRSRDKAKRYVLGSLLGLVAVSMVITLVPGFGTPSTGSEQVLAEIGGQPLTMREVQTTMQSVMRNRQIPQEMVQHYVPTLIDQMIAERATAYQAERMGFRVSDEDVALAIRSMLTGLFPNNEFNRDIYARYLGQMGLTIDQFERNVRTNLLMMKMESITLEGVIVTPGELEQEYKRRNENLKVDYVMWNPKDARSEVQASPEEIQKHYEALKTQFMLPEKRSFHLLVADEAKLAAAVQIPEAQVRGVYNSNVQQYQIPERVHARHILVKTVDKPKEEVAKLEAKANDLLKQIKGGADFGELAKKHSEDPGSGAKGGDLDWVTRGQMVKNFEETAFSLKAKEISNVIKTEYGFHIVQSLEKEEARVRPFEEVRAQIETDLKKQATAAQMQGAVEQARAELLRAPQQAPQIAAKYNLTYAKAENVSGQDPLPEIGQSQELATALSGLPVGQVTGVVQVAPTRMALAAVTAVNPPRQAQLAEVESQVREAVVNQKAMALTEQRKKEMLQKFKGATDLAALAKSVGGEIKSAPAFNREGAVEGLGPATYVSDAFTKPVGSVVGPIEIGPQLFMVKVTERIEADMSKLAAERESILLALKRKKAGERRELFQDGLMTELIKSGKVKKFQDNIRRFVAGYQG